MLLLSDYVVITFCLLKRVYCEEVKGVKKSQIAHFLTKKGKSVKYVQYFPVEVYYIDTGDEGK